MSTVSDAGAPLVLVMAAGTGGHVYPALAVAERLRTCGMRVQWLGTRSGIEAQRVPAAGFVIHHLRVAGLRGKGWRRWLVAPLALSGALIQALRILGKIRPRLVLGMGGYVSGPGGIAAWLLRRPLLIHEQNAIPGLTNRLLAPFAMTVMEGFPGSFAVSRRACHTGNPVRAEIAALVSPAQRFARRGPVLRLLVIGGSQGARRLNRIVPEALAACAAANLQIAVRHQAGARNLADARAAYIRAGASGEPEAYIEDMAAAYEWADLVVCRAGAMTIAELTAAGVASVLVPFPFAVDDHQTRNAEFLSRRGAALLVPEEEFSAGRLRGLLGELAGARERLLEMALAARRLAVPDATERVVERCLEAARG